MISLWVGSPDFVAVLKEGGWGDLMSQPYGIL